MYNFEQSLLNLKNSPVHVFHTNAHLEAGMAPVQLGFVDGSKIHMEYWRLIIDGKAGLSSFDHLQQYGLPAPIDAIKQLQLELENKTVIEVRLEKETGDLLFQFTGNTKLQIFNFTGYETWDVSFPDGTGEYSNYNK
jgi:hypothetical protein